MKKVPEIDVETIPQAVAKREPQAIQLHNEPLTPSQMRTRLDLVRNVMAEAMTEGQDYGKIPGCGDKPGLFQPGAQKLSMMFQLNPEVREEIVTDYPNYNRGFRIVVRVVNGDKFAEGVGECSTLESKYRYRNQGKKCPECGKETIIKGKQEYGGGWICFAKKGGCAWKCNDGTPAAKELESQASGKVEADNAPDFWNTVRKMAFKRAFVHAIINATNTSELWSQDLEDLAANGVLGTAGQQDAAEAKRKADQRSRMSQDDEIPMGGKTPLAEKENTPNQAQRVKNDTLEESEQDRTTRKTLLTILRKKLGNKKDVELEVCRFFQNVPSQSKKWKGQLLLGSGMDGTFERMKLDALEFVVQKFENWIVQCQEWLEKHPKQT